MTAGDVLWTPPADIRRNSRIGRYLDWLAADRGRDFADYQSLWRWSIDEPAEFWRTIWDHFDVRSYDPPRATLEHGTMPGGILDYQRFGPKIVMLRRRRLVSAAITGQPDR